jgi:hypothetical protein
VLLLVTGASGAGKTASFDGVQRALERAAVVCADFDAVGVSPDADTVWRQRTVEHWVQRAAVEQRLGRHFVLFGQVPVGELLAAPSTASIDGVGACLLHCSAEVRRERLIGRGEDPNQLDAHVAFGDWLHEHTLDPTHKPDVIRVPGSVEMRWDRWESWSPGDPRWSFEVIDTDLLTTRQVGAQVKAWIVRSIT